MSQMNELKELEKRVKALEEKMNKIHRVNRSDKIWRIIEVIGLFTTIVISISALVQTSRNRDIDYKPELRISTSAFGMTWNENGDSLADNEQVYQEVKRYLYNTQVDSNPFIEFQNIASKPAKDIKVSWENEKNVKSISEALDKVNSDTVVYLEKGLFVIQRENEKKYIQANTDQEINFLSNDSPQGNAYLSIPGTYYDLIKDIVKENIDYRWELKLELLCTCKDLQNKNHHYKIELILSPNYCYGYNNKIVDGKSGCVLGIKADITEIDRNILPE